jgi:hypothetical protein
MRDLGDFQTPRELVEKVLDRVDGLGAGWSRVLEPTSGLGAFIDAVIGRYPTAELSGIELQEHYAANSSSKNVTVLRHSIFDVDLAGIAWKTRGPLLVVGNPPWITSSELGTLGSANIPRKENFKRLPGLAAKTGEANFDLTEYIWLKLISELRAENPTIALLCKTSVARNVFRFMGDREIGARRASLWQIDAKHWFGASVDACLFCVEFDTASAPLDEVAVYSDIDDAEPARRLGYHRGRLVADAAAYRRVANIDGESPAEWRQGIKHDAARVMELRENEGQLVNGLGDVVDVEREYVFPLLKGTDVFRGIHGSAIVRRVIVPQRVLGEDTLALEQAAPRLWAYLMAHHSAFEQRKSSIYRGRAPFSIFGVGDYSFAPFKVAVSGLHKQPRFLLVSPVAGRPVMLDDTCYFLPCSDVGQAAVFAALLESEPVADLLAALIFTDSKRPVTKRLLQRIDLQRALVACDGARLLKVALEKLAGIGAGSAIGPLDDPRRVLGFARPRPDQPADPAIVGGTLDNAARTPGMVRGA